MKKEVLTLYKFEQTVSEAENFYRKTVGAEYIKGGNPKNSVYSNLIMM